MFTFLTPSFLTKLQDFRESAKKNEFIFLLGTNYYDRIDSAARRAGRIDRKFLIVYPDRSSRAHIILGALLKEFNKESKKAKIQEKIAELREFLQWGLDPTIGQAKFLENLATHTGFLSHQAITSLIKYLVTEDIQDVIDELHATDRGEGTRFKPEISLSEYANRPGAMDEIKKIADVIPKDKFPWQPSSRRKGAGGPVQLRRELDDLHRDINENLKFKNLMKKEIAKRFPTAKRRRRATRDPHPRTR